MTRIFRLSTLLMLGCMSCNYGFGQTVDVEEARSRAMDLLNQNRPKLANGRQRTNTDVETVKLSYTAQSEDSVFYYVFDYADGGFSIIGGDEVARTVLGYCPDGKFDHESMPDGLRFMLQCFESQIRAGMQAKNSIEEETNSARRASAREKSDIEPLIKSRWGQGDPYNAKIPEYDEWYGPFPVGCGATAAAQVMKYYKHPVKGLGFNSYQKVYYTDQGIKTLTFEANFGQTTYDWDNMPDDIRFHYSRTEPHFPLAEVEALSTLCYHVGVAMNMDYQRGGSASFMTSAIDALPKFFGYNKGARLEYRFDHSEDDEWEQMVYDELAKGRPVLYYGVDFPAGGHAFVCDGYQVETNLFHMNWGWNGIDDGYYALTGDKVLNPSRYEFEAMQGIVLDLYPAEEETEWIPVEKIEIVDHIKLNGHLEAIVSPSNATLPDVCWTSSDPSIATVDADGKVWISEGGIANITVTACDGSGVTQTCYVSDGNVLVTGTPDVQSNLMPMGNFYKNSTVVMEFSRDEMFGMPVFINTISFNVATSSALEADIDIYIIDRYASEDDLTEENLVYRGHRTIGKYAGWECIRLDRPYINWGGDMKVIVTHRSETYDGTLQYYCTKMSDDDEDFYAYAKYRVSDTDPRYADVTYTLGYTYSNLRPQVAFGYQTELQVQCGDAAQLEVDLFDYQFWIAGEGALWNDWQGKSHFYKQLTPNIGTMVIEPGITTIPSSAFEGVNGLETVILADRYTSKHLSGANNLYVGVTYPGLEEIEDGAFANMTDLWIVESGLIPPVIGPNTFANETLKNALLLIPEGSEEAYRNAPYWSDFENIQVLEDISKTYVGDMNKDKRLDVSDLTSMVLQVKNTTETTQSNAYMDVNRDGWVNKDDVAALASILLRIRLK